MVANTTRARARTSAATEHSRQCEPQGISPELGGSHRSQAQTGIGHAITDNGSDWLIGVHVPLAVIIYGVAVRLSIQTATHVRNRPHSARRVVPGRTDT
ncbi:MAG: hypothetical protein ABI251_03665 [Mycobacteriaceae bacterium]